ncbi:unnamed protein product [Polarella glacialis]|uniref:Uncharacterized protein n=1 Tax=Polarella glacialis TaxID=89957 RepID=A0A813HGG9_POLGL|nr:unnamed protein product [Polarella glacialis]CAE8636783.1 unnamed protein product [Polarella glacialis]CAE8743840.1 unnamed protein product [Polarella glacialis]
MAFNFCVVLLFLLSVGATGTGRTCAEDTHHQSCKAAILEDDLLDGSDANSLVQVRVKKQEKQQQSQDETQNQTQNWFGIPNPFAPAPAPAPATGGQGNTNSNPFGFPNPFAPAPADGGHDHTDHTNPFANPFAPAASNPNCDAMTQEMANAMAHGLSQGMQGPSQGVNPIQTVLQHMVDSMGGKGPGGATMNPADALTCTRKAFNFADPSHIPDECMIPGSSGKVDPACCMYVKRCSPTNPLDSCPWETFGYWSPGVTCVGSNPLSPVATGVCKCRVGNCLTGTCSQR